MMVYTLTGKIKEVPTEPKFENWLLNFSLAEDGKYRIVYCTHNKINHNNYVGKHTTKDYQDGYSGSGLLLERAIKKYGKENFETRFCCFCETNEDLNEAEKYWIAYFESIENGYNIAIGGGGGNLGEEVNRRISIGIKRAKLEGKEIGFKSGDENIRYWKGKKGPNHPRYKVSHTEKTCHQMSLNHSDVSGENNPNFGNKQEIVICPHCNKSGGIYAMHQWHFDNCKQKNNE